MTKANRYLPLSKIEAGMILADDLLDKQGHMLLPAQTPLSSAMINSISQHGIHQLSIQIEKPSEEQLQQESAVKLARLEQIFRLSLSESGNQQLHELLLAYRQDQSK